MGLLYETNVLDEMNSSFFTHNHIYFNVHQGPFKKYVTAKIPNSDPPPPLVTSSSSSIYYEDHKTDLQKL